MISTYRNPWYRPDKDDPEIYRTEAKPVEHRGCLLFQRLPGRCWDAVKDGVCFSQMTTREGAARSVDLLLDGVPAGSPDEFWRDRMVRVLSPSNAGDVGRRDGCPPHLES